MDSGTTSTTRFRKKLTIFAVGILALALCPCSMMLVACGSGGSDWTRMYRGKGHYPLSVWGSSPTDVFAVGEPGTILRYDGTTWSKMDSGTTALLFDVWGTSPSDVFAVGDTILHYDGSTWSRMEIATVAIERVKLSGVWGTSSSDVFAVGSIRNDDWSLEGAVLHYDGTTWSRMEIATVVLDHLSRLSGVWGTSSSDVFAIGKGISRYSITRTILHYDGTTWSTMDSGVTSLLSDVWGTSASDVFAVGDEGTILHYDGSTWTVMDSGTTAELFDVWGSSSHDVFAVGGRNTILHYDGSKWSTMSSGTTNLTLYGVWGSSPSDVFVVGWPWFGPEAGFILHYAG